MVACAATFGIITVSIILLVVVLVENSAKSRADIIAA